MSFYLFLRNLSLKCGTLNFISGSTVLCRKDPPYFRLQMPTLSNYNYRLINIGVKFALVFVCSNLLCPIS